MFTLEDRAEGGVKPPPGRASPLTSCAGGAQRLGPQNPGVLGSHPPGQRKQIHSPWGNHVHAVRNATRSGAPWLQAQGLGAGWEQVTIAR